MLKPNDKILFKAIVGSQAYGTATPTSDIDYKGIYLQSNRELLTYKYIPQIEVNKDFVYFELNRVIELLSTGNPTMLELLYSPEDCIQISSEQYELLRKNSHIFLTKKCKNSFAGYAVQQIQKAKGLNKKMNWEKERTERKSILDFMSVYNNNIGPKKLSEAGFDLSKAGLTKLDRFPDTYLLHIHEDLNGILSKHEDDIKTSVVPKDSLPVALVHLNKQTWQQHCKDWQSYQTWLKERNIARYVNTQNHGQQIDGKNLMHCIRLLDMAEEIAVKGEFNVRRPNAQELIDIRLGKVNLEELIEKAEAKIKRIDELFDTSELPEEVNNELIEYLIVQIRKL